MKKLGKWLSGKAKEPVIYAMKEDNGKIVFKLGKAEKVELNDR
jgi:hypothetical protein